MSAVKEIRFIFSLLRDMRVPVKLLIMVSNYNIGVMCIAENASLGTRTSWSMLRMVSSRLCFFREKNH
jgi:hypothetical protein